ncbi:triple gene block protein 1 [Cherry virus Turkey]|nr:triple gene block protein 1 [Cherry virus Turkey]QCO31669.1 triple gene block protein 1 [Cherry virus Turkey]QNT38355.1 TGB1 [Cherry virus Turkey]
MEIAHEELIRAGFKRTNLPISFPIVVHGVPGCGKTRFIKNLLSNPLFNAQTYGSVVPFNLAGRGISRAPSPLLSGFNILDEYLSGPAAEGFDLLLSDPYQNSQQPRSAHYTNSVTHRFGNSVCQLLQSLGFEISSAKVGDTEVEIRNIFNSKLIGEVIAFEPAAVELLHKHSARFSHPCEVRGSEFEEVTFVSASRDLQSIVGADLYISLTRAKKKCLILKPGGR